MIRWLAFLRGWSLGIALGAGLALLLAPKRGEELRAALRQGWQQLWQEVRRAAQEEQTRLEAELRRLQGLE